MFSSPTINIPEKHSSNFGVCLHKIFKHIPKEHSLTDFEICPKRKGNWEYSIATDSEQQINDSDLVIATYGINTVIGRITNYSDDSDDGTYSFISIDKRENTLELPKIGTGILKIIGFNDVRKI